MIDYQNVYIVLCCVIIYSCIKTNFSGFFILNLITVLYFLHEEQSVILKNSSTIASAKASQETSEHKEEEKELNVTVNPRKNKELKESLQHNKKAIVGETNSAKVDNKNSKPSPYQHSYEQRKRLLESIYMDLETNNKWKSQDPTCKSIRSQSNYKL